MLILSLFPGIDLLGLAFEQEWPDACVVRGPDLLWLHKNTVRAPFPWLAGYTISTPHLQQPVDRG